MARLDLIGAREKIEALLSKEEDPGVLRKVAEALGEIGDINSAKRLEEILHGESAGTRRIVQRAIRRIHERNESKHGD
jgi:HEAT repeat protein